MANARNCVVVGGSLVGTAAACALRLAGVTVRVIEARATPVADGRWYALNLASQAVLQRLGVWALLPPEQIAPYTQMTVWENAATLNLSAAEAKVPCLGYMVAHTTLLAALLRRLDALAVPITQASLHGLALTPAAARLSLSDGSTWQTQLVIGADGADSQTRQLAQIPVERHNYAQAAVVAVITHAASHAQTARQRFLPTGPLALLPLPDAQHSALVWTLPQAQVESTLALSNAEFCLSLETASEASVGAILDCTPRQAFPLRAQQAARYCGLRLALVGDAAHVIHPLAGQGVNLGLLDVAALVEAITAQRDPGSLLALRHYERLRRADNTQMLMAMSALNTVFSLEQPWLGALRRQGIQAINSLALVKRPLMLAAAGLRPPPLALTRLSWTL